MDASDTFRQLVEAHQRELRVHCYRMLGSLQDAEDQTQETLLRAWRSHDSFSGRSSLRAWLYRIATNVCLDELDRRDRRRLLPHMIGRPSPSFGLNAAPIDDTPWLEPFPDAWLDLADSEPGPDVRYETREAIELAFVAALQHLPARQRAVLLLRDVLGFAAQDVATLLDTSVAAANSALQRARERLETVRPSVETRLEPVAERALLERYVTAWESGDIDTLVSLLKEDAVLSMPPLAEWYSGRVAIAEFFAWACGPSGPGPFRLVWTRANNAPAFGIYGPGPAGPGSNPLILHVVDVDRDGIGALTSFMNPALLSAFGLAPPAASPAAGERP